MKPWDVHFALRFLRGELGRAALAAVALACGVALVCAIDLVNRSVLVAFTEVIDAMAGRAALFVASGDGALFPEEVAATVAAVPGVTRAIPVVSARAFVAGEDGVAVTVHGLDVTDEGSVSVYGTWNGVEDPLVFVAQPDSIAVTRVFARRRGLEVGHRLPLLTPGGRRSFTVRGILDADGVARVYAGDLIVMDLFAAEAAFTRPGFVNRVDVVLAHDRDVAATAGVIGAALPSGLKVDTPGQRKADLHRVVRSLHAMLQAVGLVALVAAFLIAFNRLGTMFEERVWQIGIVRALGGRPRAVWTELVKEGLLVGTAGVALGLPLGVAIGRLALPAIAAATALNYKLPPADPALAVHASSLLLAAVLGLGAAFLAAAVPAARAVTAHPAEVLRLRGVEGRVSNGRSMWLVRGAVALAAAATVAAQSTSPAPQWGLAATALVALATALAARPLLALVQPLAAAAGKLGGPSWRLAAGAIEQHPRRTALTVGMVAVGIGGVLWLRTLAVSFERTVVESLTPAYRADITVNSAHLATGFIEAPLDGGLLAELAALPAVAAVAGIRITDWPFRGGPVALNAFDPRFFRTGEFGRYPLVGPRAPAVWEAVARGEAAVVSSNFAHNLGVRVGETIELESPKGPIALRVAGVTNDFTSARGTIEMSRELYQRYWDDPTITRAFVRAEEGADLEALREAIRDGPGRRHELRLLSARELMEHFRTQVRRAFASVGVLRDVVLLLVLIGIADTLGAGVVARTRELGAIRALGVRPRSVAATVVIEAVLVAALGLLLGAAAGVTLAALWVKATFPALLGWVLELHIPLGEGVAISALTLGAAALAALLPAGRAAALRPAAALRHE